MNIYKYSQRANKLSSEGQALHPVKGFLQAVQPHRTRNAEMSGASAAEQRAGCDQDMGPFQERLTEVLGAEAGFLNAGEEVEGTLGPYQTEVGDLLHPVRRVENAVPVGQNVFLTNGLPDRQRLYGGPLGDGRGRINQGVVDVAHDLQYLRLRDGYAHPPAGHEKILGKAGFRDLLIVKEQEMPDGDFPTVSSPNPENEDALSLGIRLGMEEGADIVIGTDPDSDRIGAAVRKGSQFTLISGNQMGALLTYFLLSTGKDRLTPASTLVKTVVTGELAADIAESFHVQVVETLTGFKYIGEKITEWERNPVHDFVFGFEESYGYLAGTHARDKDAVVTAMLICEMAAYFKSLGKTLTDVLAELYETYGYYYDKSLSYTLKGLEGGRRIAAIMEEARSLDMKSVIPETVETLDFEKGIGGLPRENVLKYRLAGGGWFAIRPSGTEPKIKFYYSLRGRNEEEALRLFGAYRSSLEKQFGL